MFIFWWTGKGYLTPVIVAVVCMGFAFFIQPFGANLLRRGEVAPRRRRGATDSDFPILRKGKRVFHVHPEIAHCVLDLATKDLDGTNVAGSPVDDRCLRSAKGVRGILASHQTDTCYPFIDEPGILASAEGQAGLAAPVLTYLFHRPEKRLDGRPTLQVLDEAWIFLDHALFAARIREWLKVLRKKNVSVLFATQSLADITSSAIEPPSREAYARFGLNDRHIELVSRAALKRQYYFRSGRGIEKIVHRKPSSATGLYGRSFHEVLVLI